MAPMVSALTKKMKFEVIDRLLLKNAQTINKQTPIVCDYSIFMCSM